MTATVKGWGTAVADNLNPFSRLVHTAAADDGAMNVPHFQLEKVKEAAFQSDYGLDCVAKAIMAHLDYPSVVVKLKTLQLVRFLMLEGPAAFSAKTSVSMGKFASMGIALQDARPNTVEASVRSLAQAIHEAFQGKTGALHRAFGENDQLRNVAGQEGSGAHGKAKSDFQEAQERQAKLYRKQREQEARNRDIIVLDKAYEQFDSNLTAPKLVASAVQSQKKKHADPELNNFAHATSEHARPAEVAAALDAVLKDSREPIQNRFKALMIVDYLISTQPIAEVITYFKANSAGLQRTLQLVDSSPKGQQMTAVTQQLLSRLPTISVPRPSDRSSSAGSHHDSSSAAAASPPPPQAAVPPTPPVKPAQPVLGASNVNPAFDGGPVLDTMFGQMEVRKPASGRPRGNSTTSSTNNAAAGSGGWPTSNSGAASGGVNSGAANWSWDAPAGASAANSTAAVAGTASVGAWGASWGGESALAPAASSSWQSQPPQQQQQQQPQQPPRQQPQQQAPLSPEEQLRLMQEQFQSNMAAMAALAGGNPMMPPMQQQFQQQPQQQQQPPQSQQQASLMMASPSSGSYPPPQPQSTASMEQHNDDSPLDSKSQPQSPVGALSAVHGGPGASSGVASLAARNGSGGGAAAAAASSSQASPAVPLWGSSVMEPPPLDVNGDDEHNAAERPSAPVPGAAPSVQPTPAGSRASHSIQFDLSVGSLASPAGMLSQNHHLGGPAHQHYVDPADNSSQALPSVSMTPLLVPNQQSPKSHNTTPQQQTPPTSTVGNGSNGGGRVTVEMLQQLQAQMQQTHEILQRQQLMYAHMQQRYMAQQQEDLARMSAQMHHRTS